MRPRRHRQSHGGDDMSDKPEALRLADALEQGKFLLSVERDATAAELRRLHGIEFALRDCEVALAKMAKKYMDAADRRDELLEALQEVVVSGLLYVRSRADIDKATGGDTMTLDQLHALADKFFEWPEGSDGRTVTQHVLKMREESLATKNSASTPTLHDAAQQAEPAQPMRFRVTVIDNAHPDGIPLEQWVRRDPTSTLKADAERYRYLLGHARRIDVDGWSISHMEQLSPRIDAAREEP